MNLLAALTCGVLGVVLGTASQLLVRRMPIHQSLTSTAHHCSNCGTPSRRGQSISLLAQIKGDRFCHTCSSPLWPRRPALEIFCAVALAVVGWRIGFSATLPAYIVFFITLALITVIDLRHYMIPTRLVWPALLATMLLLALASISRHDSTHIRNALIGMAVSWFFFALVWFIYPKGMGFGDVRLAAFVGLVSGYVGLGNVLVTIMLSLVLGSLVGVVLIVMSVRKRKEAIPFGPFLAAGATISVLFGTLLPNGG